MAEKVGVEIIRRIRLSKDLIERMGSTVEQYERVVLNALIRTPKLAEVDPDALAITVMQCVEAGLLPDGNQAVIVPFKQNCSLIPMIEGRLRLARRATPGLAVKALCVYREDDFVHVEGLKPILEHTPNPSGARGAADIIAAYAIAWIPGASVPEFEVCYREDIDRHKARSSAVKMGRSSPWDTDFGEMAERVPLGLLLKRLPKRIGDPPDSPEAVHTEDIHEASTALQLEAAKSGPTNAAPTGKSPQEEEKKPEPRPRRRSRRPDPEPAGRHERRPQAVQQPDAEQPDDGDAPFD